MAFYLTFFLAYTLTFILSDIQSPWPPKFWPILMSSSLEANLIFLHFTVNFTGSMNHHQAFLIYPPIYPAMSIHLSIHPTIYPTTIILLYFYMEWWSTPTSTSTHLNLHQYQHLYQYQYLFLSINISIHTCMSTHLSMNRISQWLPGSRRAEQRHAPGCRRPAVATGARHAVGAAAL